MRTLCATASSACGWPITALGKHGHQAEHRLDLVLDHLAERNAGPGGDDLGHHQAIDLHRHQRCFALQRRQFRAFRAQGGEGRAHGRVVDLGRTRLAGTGRRRGGLQRSSHRRRGRRRRLEITPETDDLVDQQLLGFVALLQGGEFRGHAVTLGMQLAEALAVRAAAGRLALECSEFRFEAAQHLAAVFHGRRRGALSEGHLGAGGVEHADGLVGQLAAADVAGRETNRLGDGFVEQAHLEVGFHQRRQATQHGSGNGLARLLDLHHLEAARQRGVFLEVLLVFTPGGGGDGPELATRQCRLEQVGGVALPGRAAGADHGVGFVDEQDDRMRALLDLADHVLQAVLELALHARPGLQQPHVEHVNLHALQRRRHAAFGDAQGEALDHRGLADPGLAGEDGVVLAPAHQDVDNLANLGLAADDRIELAFARTRREVEGELVEGWRLRQLGGRGCSVATGRCLSGSGRGPTRFLGTARGFGQAVLELVDRHLREQPAVALRQLRQPGLGEEGQQQMAATDAAVVRVDRGDQPGLFEPGSEVGAEHRRARVAGLEPRHLALEVAAQGVGRDIEAPAQRDQVAAGFVEQGEQQVLDVDLVVAARHRCARSAFSGATRRVVQLADQGLEVDAHQCSV